MCQVCEYYKLLEKDSSFDHFQKASLDLLSSIMDQHKISECPNHCLFCVNEEIIDIERQQEVEGVLERLRAGKRVEVYRRGEKYRDVN